MRTRSRAIALQTVTMPEVDYTWSFKPCTGDSVSGTNHWSNTVFHPEEISETMKDELGQGKPHNCIHDVVYHKTSDDSTTYQYGYLLDGKNGVYTLALPNYLRWSCWLNHHYIVGLSSSQGNMGRGWSIGNLSISEESLKNDCIERSRQTVADVLLNIAEANQIVPSVKSLTSALPDMARNWRKIRKVVRTASGSFLAWKFGVSPILSDVMNIHRFMGTISERYKRHEQGTLNRVGVRADLPCTFVVSQLSPTIQNGYETWRFNHTGRAIESPVLRYVLVTKPIVPKRTELFKKLDFAMGRFATSPASLAWELVPFSFVVDWLVDVRGALNAIDNSLGYKPYEVVSFTRSLSYKLVNSTSVIRKSPCDGGVVWQGEMGSTTVKHYERSLVSAEGVLPQWRSRFGKNQAAISAALITQALSKIRK